MITRQSTVVTDASGSYRFDDLAPGTYVVVPEVESKVLTPTFRQVVIVDESAMGEDFALAPSSGVVASVVGKAETGADAEVLTYAPPAVLGVYRLIYVFSVSSLTGTSFGLAATWRGPGGALQSNIVIHFARLGTNGFVLTNNVVASYYADVLITTDDSSTPIVLKTTLTGTAWIYTISAAIICIL